jgi:hypothetical protein
MHDALNEDVVAVHSVQQEVLTNGKRPRSKAKVVASSAKMWVCRQQDKPGGDRINQAIRRLDAGRGCS